jgi:SOS-response transcriptional repressor LexA
MIKLSKLTDDELFRKAKIVLYREELLHGFKPGILDSDRIYFEFEQRGLEDKYQEIFIEVIERCEVVRDKNRQLSSEEQVYLSNFTVNEKNYEYVVPRIKDVGEVVFDLNAKKIALLKKLITDETFFLDVKGDSMIGKNINPGDIIIVNRKNKAKVGDVVCLRIGDSYIIKTLLSNNGQIILKSENDLYADFIVTEDMDFEIIGIVKHVISAL